MKKLICLISVVLMLFTACGEDNKGAQNNATDNSSVADKMDENGDVTDGDGIIAENDKNNTNKGDNTNANKNPVENAVDNAGDAAGDMVDGAANAVDDAAQGVENAVDSMTGNDKNNNMSNSK